MGYCLSLSDGSRWYITANIENTEFLFKLAKIMKLKECEQDNFYELAFSDTDQKKLDSHDPEWKVYENPSIRILYNEDSGNARCEIKDNSENVLQYINMNYSLMPIYSRSISFGGLPFHSGLAELNGKGVLFSATGSTGKSTCCRRLPNYWKPLCDDEMLVVLDKTGNYIAHPFPTWSDYTMERMANTWDVQYSVPLSAIFFLEQSEIDEVIPLQASHSAVRITDSASQVYEKFLRRISQEEKIAIRSQIFSNAYEIAKKIPAFRLRVSLNGTFWEKVEEVI